MNGCYSLVRIKIVESTDATQNTPNVSWLWDGFFDAISQASEMNFVVGDHVFRENLIVCPHINVEYGNLIQSQKCIKIIDIISSWLSFQLIEKSYWSSNVLSYSLALI